MTVKIIPPAKPNRDEITKGGLVLAKTDPIANVVALRAKQKASHHCQTKTCMMYLDDDRYTVKTTKFEKPQQTHLIELIDSTGHRVGSLEYNPEVIVYQLVEAAWRILQFSMEDGYRPVSLNSEGMAIA